MSEQKALYVSPGEKGKSGFEDLEFYQLALEVMARCMIFLKACLLKKSSICLPKSGARRKA